MTSALAKQESPALLRIDEARRILAECVRVDEVKDIRDRAQAVATYYRERGVSLEIQNDAAEVRLRAERRLGELLATMPKATGHRFGEGAGGSPESPPALGEIGITKKQSSVWQRIAALAEDEFEDRVAEAKENGLELTTSRVLRGPPPPEVRPSRAAPPPPPPSKAAPMDEDDFTNPGHVSSLVFEAVAPLDALYERWPNDLSLRPLISIIRDRLDRFDAWEREQEKRRRGNGAV